MTIQERLDAYIAAEAAILRNQEYTVDGVTFKKTDLRAVQSMIVTLENRIAKASSGGRFACSTVRFV